MDNRVKELPDDFSIVNVDGNSYSNMAIGNTVIMDSNAYDYPLASVEILFHEIDHIVTPDTLWEQLKLEFKHDLQLNMGLSYKDVQSRRYIRENAGNDVYVKLNLIRKLYFPFLELIRISVIRLYDKYYNKRYIQ